MPKVNKRGGFSDRNQIKPVNIEIQLSDFDKRTRIQLQNKISEFYEAAYKNMYYGEEAVQNFYRYVIGTVYSEPIDWNHVYRYDDVFKMIFKTIQEDDFDDVLTLIEAIVQYLDRYFAENALYYDSYYYTYEEYSLFQVMNNCLKKEYVGYRFVDRIIVPISDQNEITAIVETLDCNYEVVKNHISKANIFLADRNKPDYENSIKESISAVEAMCEILTGITGKEATLGKLLKKLEENGVVIHSGLKSAFNILYGYTSDANGIRHAGDIGGNLATFEEAKFMLVSCCAFVNYLIAISAS